MTLGEGKRKVLMLMDEYSSGGALTTDKDIDLRMADFFDLAQKDVAGVKRIVRSFVPAAVGGDGVLRVQEAAPYGDVVVCPVPEDFGQVFRVWRDGRITNRYAWRGAAVLLPPADVGRVVVEYFAVPKAIPHDAKDEYKFEVAEDAAACMPYFVAAQQLIVDLVVDASPLLALYDRSKSMLDTRLPTSGGGGVRQAFYGGRR